MFYASAMIHSSNSYYRRNLVIVFVEGCGHPEVNGTFKRSGSQSNGSPI